MGTRNLILYVDGSRVLPAAKKSYQSFGYAATRLHPENYKPHWVEQLMQRLHTVASHAFDRSVIEPVLAAFRHSRIVKLKGHSLHVYQERVDYLARFAARRGVDGQPADAQPMSMEEWLASGIVHYAPAPGAPDGQEPEYVQTTWHAPFVQAAAA